MEETSDRERERERERESTEKLSSSLFLSNVFFFFFPCVSNFLQRHLQIKTKKKTKTKEGGCLFLRVPSSIGLISGIAFTLPHLLSLFL
jgi:hypothetical protein